MPLHKHRRLWLELSRDEVFEVMKLRHEIFVMEQKIVDEEYDELDRAPKTEHWWYQDESGVCCYLRVICEQAPTKIGRVVTRKNRRGQGLASQLMKAVIAAHPEQLALSAQSHLEGWYATFGFVRDGANYLEAGISHCRMVREPTSA